MTVRCLVLVPSLVVDLSGCLVYCWNGSQCKNLEAWTRAVDVPRPLACKRIGKQLVLGAWHNLRSSAYSGSGQLAVEMRSCLFEEPEPEEPPSRVCCVSLLHTSVLNLTVPGISRNSLGVGSHFCHLLTHTVLCAHVGMGTVCRDYRSQEQHLQ